MELFYGASLEDACQITREGFQIPRTAGRFGRGISFAPCPLKAASLSPEQSWVSWVPFADRVIQRTLAAFKKEKGHMLLSDVYLGNTKTVRTTWAGLNPTEDLKGGWLRDKLGLGDYNSVYAPAWFFGTVNVSEYVVYKQQQGLPRYLLEFEYVYA